MTELSRVSRERLFTCHPDLQLLVMAVAKRMRLQVIQGHRGKEEQNLYFTTGRSQLAWPFSKHNKIPSEAVDCAPLQPDGTINWNDLALFREMVETFKQEATRLNLSIRCGGDWQRFKDFPHIELVNARPGDDTVA